MFANSGVRVGRRFSRLLVAAGLLLPFLAAAAPATSAADQDEEAGSTYARVRYLEGALSVERPSDGDVIAATANLPIVPGDRVFTGDGRAEIELADSSVLYLDGATRLEIRSLADYDNQYERTNLLTLREGAIRIDSRDAPDADSVFQIDTEAGSVYLLSGGSFRIESNGGETLVSSFSGVAEFSGDGGSVLVRSGQRSAVVVGAGPDEPRRFNTSRADDFDRFHDDRLSAYSIETTAPAIVEEVPVEVRPYVRELTYYGTWTTLAPYGVVWRPVFAGGWSPYVNGAWAWYPTGWVWVSYDPWGWAPYRYGRWDYASTVGWFWVPGRVWSGAWVSFAVSTTHVGWCPLNYWNRPVFHDPWVTTVPAVTVTRLDPRGWQFVPVGRFGARGVASVATRLDRLPRGTEVVVTRRLPAPPRSRGVVAARPEPASALVDEVRRSRVALPAASNGSGEPMSFRAQEQRRAASTPPAASRRIAAPPRRQTRPAPVAGIAPPQGPQTSSPSRGPTARPADTATAPANPAKPQTGRPPRDKNAPRSRPAAPPPQRIAAQPPAAPGSPAATTRPPATMTRPQTPAAPSAPPAQGTPGRPTPSQSKRNDPPAHDPALGRLVGGTRPAPAAPPPAASVAPGAPGQAGTPASQERPTVSNPPPGKSRSEAAREKHQGKPSPKPKPKDTEPPNTGR